MRAVGVVVKSAHMRGLIASSAALVVAAGTWFGATSASADSVQYQSYQRASQNEACVAQPGETPWQASWGADSSWRPSWEQWANGGRGGWTCGRAITWARDPVAAGAAAITGYSVGDTGPGGGIVFITPTTSGNTTGQYFEAAPSALPGLAWCNNYPTLIAGTFGTAIGTGKTNTDNMVAGGACTSGAANSVRGYGTAGAPAGSWFLPSKDELTALYTSGVGGTLGWYWSSSQISNTDTWQLNPASGVTNADKNASDDARPVRAF